MSALPIVPPAFHESDLPAETGFFQLAQPRHIKHSCLSRTAAQLWAVLCERRNGKNEAWPKIQSIARDCRISERTVQRGLAELKRAGWLGMLARSTGGGSHAAAVYHLHPNGAPCARCQKPQGTHHRKSPELEHKTHQSEASLRGDTLSSLGVTKTTSRGDKNDSAYKEEPPKNHPERGRPVSFINNRPQSGVSGQQFFARYTALTSVPVAPCDERKTVEIWSRMALAKRLAAWASLAFVVDGRPPRTYKLPQNYLADEPWERRSVHIEKAEPRGLRAGEIE